MNLIAQTFEKVKNTVGGKQTARRFSDHSALRSINQHKSLGSLLGIANPFFRLAEEPQGSRTTIDGKRVTNFAWCDYLGLSQHPELIEAAQQAIGKYGTSVSASRMVCGDTPLHRELEHEIADFMGVDAALAFVSGHAANVSTIGTLMCSDDIIIHDEFVHNSAVVGMRLSGAKTVSFRHNDLDALETLLRDERGKHKNALVVIEGLYSTEGDVPDLERVIELKQRYGAWLMVDDAHGIGVLGETGRGCAELCGVDARDVDIWMGTLSKALASCGGYIAGNKDLIEILKYSAPGFVFSVGLPPSMTATAITAFRILRREPERLQRMRDNGSLFLNEAQSLGLDTGRAIGIGMVPIMVGSLTKSTKMVTQMYDRGISTSLIVSPGVPVNAGRLRFFISAMNTEDEICTAVRVANEELRRR